MTLASVLAQKKDTAKAARSINSQGAKRGQISELLITHY
jgi:hypothetical protein